MVFGPFFMEAAMQVRTLRNLIAALGAGGGRGTGSTASPS